MSINTTTLLLLLTTAALLLGQTQIHAQTRIDPRHPSVAYLQEWGYMVGSGLKCKPTWGEEFGRSIIPLGDVNGDAIADFLIERMSCDSAFGDNGLTQGNELLLYYGVKGALPATNSGQRIGPQEIGSESSLLASGDWNNDTYIDFALREHIFGDTSYGNNKGYTIQQLVIYWGNSLRQYSVQDTTRLSGGAGAWGAINQGYTIDANQDNIDDLLIWSGEGAGLTDGKIISLPHMYIYQGNNHSKWGQDASSHLAQWTWWNPPPMNQLVSKVLDYDCDGVIDIGIINQTFRSRASVLYGRSNQLPDTNNVESIYMVNSESRFTIFQDVTGDNVPEIITIGGDFEKQRIRIFAGKPGQRLLEQYGDGRDSADRANARFPLRPWAQIMLPNALHDGWFGSEHVLFDLGDINTDGTSEIVAHADPYIIIYTTGRTLDSLIDILYATTNGPWDTMVRVGDVDGSGVPSYAVTFAGRVHFLKAPPKDEIPTYGGRLRSLPHPVGFRCEAALGVEQYQAPEPHSPSQQIEFTQQQTIPVPPTTVTGAQQ